MEKRHSHYDLLRIFATISVVALHCTSKQWYTSEVGTEEWYILNFYDTLVRFSVPIFFMLSGVLFLPQDTTFSMNKMWKKNIPRLLIAFTFWSCLYARIHYLRGDGTYDEKDVHLSILTGNYHQWFILALVSLYVCLPILRELVSKKETIEYFLSLAFVVQFGVNLFRVNEEFDYFARGVVDIANVFLVAGYSSYFILGYYLQTYPPSKKVQGLLHLLAVVSLQITYYGTNFLSAEEEIPVASLYGYLLPTTFFVSCSVFLIFMNLKGRIPPYFERIIYQLSMLSFGVYLCHDLFLIWLLEDRFWASWKISPLWNIPLFTATVYGCSLLLTYIISRIPVLNRYLI